jgi:hypothetical protein
VAFESLIRATVAKRKQRLASILGGKAGKTGKDKVECRIS